MGAGNKAHAEEAAIERISEQELAKRTEASGFHSFRVRNNDIAVTLNSLAPSLASAADAYSQKDMAIVKFPPGVSWDDLCVRKSDGWKLLSNFKDGEFNEMAAIKQAGLQPAAIANLALQCAAVVVGQAYMAKINEQLAGLESGIADIQRLLELDKQAKLENAYKMLIGDYVNRYDEFIASAEKKQSAMIKLEDFRQLAGEIWELQLKLLKAKQSDLVGMPKPKEKDLELLLAEVRKIEGTAASSFQLLVLIRQTLMQYDGDFSSTRIERDRAALAEVLEEWRVVHDGVYGLLRTRAALLKEAPVFGRRTAKEREAHLLEAASVDQIKAFGEAHDAQLGLMDFVYNRSTGIAIKSDEVCFVA